MILDFTFVASTMFFIFIYFGYAIYKKLLSPSSKYLILICNIIRFELIYNFLPLQNQFIYYLMITTQHQLLINQPLIFKLYLIIPAQITYITYFIKQISCITSISFISVFLFIQLLQLVIQFKIQTYQENLQTPVIFSAKISEINMKDEAQFKSPKKFSQNQSLQMNNLQSISSLQKNNMKCSNDQEIVSNKQNKETFQFMNKYSWLQNEKYIFLNEDLKIIERSFQLNSSKDNISEEEIYNQLLDSSVELSNEYYSLFPYDYQQQIIFFFYYLRTFNLRALLRKIIQSQLTQLIVIHKIQSKLQINNQALRIFQQDGFFILHFEPQHSSSDNMVTNIFQSVSHEFGTYLNCLVTLSQIAYNDEEVPLDVRINYFKPLQINSYFLNLILSNVRDYNQIVMKQFMLQIDEFNIRDAISGLITCLENSLKQRNIRIQINQRVPITQISIFSDQSRFIQVFYQILSNAVRFTLNGSITIDIDFIHGKDILIISVSDTGIGMDDEEKQKLHELLDGKVNMVRVSENSVGCSMGLMISTKIAEKLSSGYGIKFESEKDRGSKFWFRIENQKQNISESKYEYNLHSQFSRLSQDSYFECRKSYYHTSQISIIRQRNVSKQSFIRQQSNMIINENQWKYQLQSPQSSLDDEFGAITVPIIKPNLLGNILKYRLDKDCCSKVLIVDDEYFNIISVQFLLKEFRARTDYAFNGQEALTMVRNKQQCLVCGNQGYILYFLDINMPIMDGLKTVQILKSQMDEGELDQGICIANTGFVDLETKMKCFEAGMDFYISKPINRQELHEYLRIKFKIL